MESQQELAQKYQEQLDSVNVNDDGVFFEDATKCDVCGSSNVHFTHIVKPVEMQNGSFRTVDFVNRNCADCPQ